MEAGGRDQGAEAGEELVGVHVGVGGAARHGEQSILRLIESQMDVSLRRRLEQDP